MRRRRHWNRPLRSAGITLAVTLALVPTAFDPASARAAPPPTAASSRAAAHTVTLLTGDRVEVAGDGTPLGVEPAAGRAGMGFVAYALDGHQYAVPQDAQPLISAGRLDPHLFDLTELVELGYDDASSQAVPLLLQSAPGAAEAQAVPAGAQVTRSLPDLAMSALSVAKPSATQIWSGLRDSSAIQHVWLNGKAHTLDDQSGPQIGAPIAYQAGFTGKGVTVAVLDTGYDPSHPDLQGVVSQARDFTSSAGGVVDKVGHGTHVASVIAGRGTASQGKYAGIARDASLVVGKVCDDHGGCPYDAIIAGMAWAASTERARVVSMSLGSRPTDGTDPLSQTVNQLTAQTGSLFVIAAGNARQFGQRVSAPAAADHALAVAAVTKQDQMTAFSSPGPRISDYAVKPDIAAPGQDIVAARATGTSMGSPIDQYYTSLSGTSMATPHVSGAAAILAQERPGWTAEQLKAALMSTATTLGGASIYDQGAGRVDIGRAVTQSVSAEVASLSMGYLPWPHTADKPISKQVTYRNDGDQTVTLDLKLTEKDQGGKPAPGGEFQLDRSTVTVPAHGTAQVTVTEDATRGIGLFSGWLTASTADGKVSVSTAVGSYVEEEKYNLTYHVYSRDGRPTSTANIITVNRATGEATYRPLSTDGTVTLRLHPGQYTVMAMIVDTGDPNKWNAGPIRSRTNLAAPALTLGKDTTLDLDARTARPVVIELPNESLRLRQEMTLMVASLSKGTAYLSGLGPDVVPQYAGSAGNPAEGFAFLTGAVAARADVPVSPVAYYLDFVARSQMPQGATHVVRNHDLARVRTAFRSGGTIGATGRSDGYPFLNGLPVPLGDLIDPVSYPMERTEYLSTEVSWIRAAQVGSFFDSRQPLAAYWSDAWPRSYHAGRTYHRTWNAAVQAPLFADRSLVNPPPNSRPLLGQIDRQGDLVEAYLPVHAHGASPDSAVYSWWQPRLEGSLVLSQNGTPLPYAYPAPQPELAFWQLPPAAGTYQLDLDATRIAPQITLSSHVKVSWTFRSAHVSGSDPALQPLLEIAYALPPEALDTHNSALHGLPLPLSLKMGRQGGGGHVRSVRAWVSFDDGATWRQVDAVGSGDDRMVLVPGGGKAGGFVSLRVAATDSEDNSIDETVIHAWQLR